MEQYQTEVGGLPLYEAGGFILGESKTIIDVSKPGESIYLSVKLILVGVEHRLFECNLHWKINTQTKWYFHLLETDVFTIVQNGRTVEKIVPDEGSYLLDESDALGMLLGFIDDV